jgi:hypothetical protein
MTKKQWKREQALRSALAVARVADIAVSDAYLLLDSFKRYERKLQRLAEIECNGYPKPVTEYRDGKTYSYNVKDEVLRLKCEKQEARIVEKVKDLAKTNKLDVTFQGDPRGLMFSLSYNGQEINFYQEVA